MIFQVDQLENDLIHEMDKLRSITEEVESTYVELSGF